MPKVGFQKNYSRHYIGNSLIPYLSVNSIFKNSCDLYESAHVSSMITRIHVLGPAHEILVLIAYMSHYM